MADEVTFADMHLDNLDIEFAVTPTSTISGSVTQNNIFDPLSSLVPSTSDTKLINGAIDGQTIAFIERVSATVIRFHGMVGASTSTFDVTDGVGTTREITIAW